MDEDHRCAGRDGLGGCRFTPVVAIAGDLACAYHIQPLIRLRLREVPVGLVTVASLGKGGW